MRRAQKRKLRGDGTDDVTALGSASVIDPVFLHSDRPLLAVIRKDEIPALTRSTVLCKSGGVSSWKYDIDMILNF